MRPGGPFEGAASHPGLNGRRQVRGGELEHAIEPAEIEADSAFDRDYVTLEAGTRPERRHGHAPGVGERERARDLVGRGGVDDEIGPAGPVEGHVRAVQVALRVAVRDPDEPGERFPEALRHDRHLPDSDGNVPATRSTAQRRLSWTIRSASSPSLATQAT